MEASRCTNKVKVKRDNLAFHEIEAEIFDEVHMEILSHYEIAKSRNNIGLITINLTRPNLCVDIGCGTGFLTALELNNFEGIVATDISRKMIKKARQKLPNSTKLNFLVCDAENLPFRNEIFDLISMSSILHHLPSPISALLEANRVLRDNGFVYITREPNDTSYSRFVDFPHRILQFVSYISKKNSRTKTISTSLNYLKVDIHCPHGFNVESLSNFFYSRHFNVVRARSYHWIFPATASSFIKSVLSKVNFLIEKLPFSWKFGRSIFVVAQKCEHAHIACASNPENGFEPSMH